MSFIEAMFNTLALQKGLKMIDAFELKSVVWQGEWGLNEFMLLPNNIFHPRKDIENHYGLRELIKQAKLKEYKPKNNLPHFLKNDKKMDFDKNQSKKVKDVVSNVLRSGKKLKSSDIEKKLSTIKKSGEIDELVDSGMDSSGVESSIAVLKRMTRERDKNVFLISRRDDLTSRVNHVLKVIKENGFTSYSNDVEIVA
jgi:hypothetical protein